nr:MAG TPA: hypothetical protein [Bacteriophage sp.]
MQYKAGINIQIIATLQSLTASIIFWEIIYYHLFIIKDHCYFFHFILLLGG